MKYSKRKMILRKHPVVWGAGLIVWVAEEVGSEEEGKLANK